MAATITANTTRDFIEPTLFQTLSSSKSSRTIAHQIIGVSDPYITFQPAGLRTGTHVMFFGADEEAALEAVEVLATSQTFTLEYPERVVWEMTFVVVGDSIELELDENSRKHFTVRFGFQEVLA